MPTDKELAEIAGSQETNIRQLRSLAKKNGINKTLDGYIARVRISKIEELLHG